MSYESQAIIDDFLGWRKEQGFRDRNGMKKNAKKLIEYLEEKDMEFVELKVRDAQEYQGWLLELEKQGGGRYDEGTIANFIKAAVSFYDFLKTGGKVASNPFSAIRRKRVRKKVIANIPSEKEMNDLLAAIGRFEEEKGLRNQKVRYRLHVLCELLYSTGMRAGEAASLRGDQIDFERGVIEFADIKGGHARRVFLNEYAKEVLRIYVTEMRELVLNEICNKTLLFGAASGEMIILLNRLLGKISNEMSIPVLTSHKFRHAFGTHFLRRGCSIRYIQELLGHKAIKNTEVYTKVDREQLKRVFDECHPRKFKGAAH